MTNALMVSVLADAELDEVTGGRGARVVTLTSVSQTAVGGFTGDFIIAANRGTTSLNNVGNTTNSSTVIVLAGAFG